MLYFFSNVFLVNRVVVVVALLVIVKCNIFRGWVMLYF